MKSILLFCLLAIAMSHKWDKIELDFDPAVLDEVYIPKAPIDIIKGLLSGCGFKEDVENIKKCIRTIQPIINQLKEAIKILIHINPLQIQEFIKGVIKLIPVIKNLANMIGPCAKEGSAIWKIIKLIKNCNIPMIIKNALFHIPKIIDGAKEIGSGIAKRNDFMIGHGLGVIIRAILL